jgi:hypothetical protein
LSARARAAAKLHHTNIMLVFGVGEQEETPYYVMQFIQGQGLDVVLDDLKRSTIAPKRCARSSPLRMVNPNNGFARSEPAAPIWNSPGQHS